MAYRKKSLRSMLPTTRKVARLIGELESVTRRAKNIIPDLQRLELDSQALYKRKEYEDKAKDCLGKLETAKAGELIVVTSAGRPLEATVKVSCGDKHNGHWYCVTHQEHFQNQLMKDFHLEEVEGGHKLVWICHEHGAEEV